MRDYIHLALCLFAAALFGGCAESEDLGGAPPDETRINSESPTWNGGIGYIFLTKCATCHTNTPDETVPRGTPEDLDLIRYQGDGITFRGATDIIPFVLAGILRAPVETPPAERMPLAFATPLTAHETEIIELWAELGGPLGDSNAGCVAPADDAEETALDDRGEEIFSSPQNPGAAPCQQCHPVAHYSGLNCRPLTKKLKFMYDEVAGNGKGTWAALPGEDQDALLFYAAR